jgi:hypothetical protein
VQADRSAVLFQANLAQQFVVGGEVAEFLVAEAALRALKTPKAFDHWMLRRLSSNPGSRRVPIRESPPLDCLPVSATPASNVAE